MCVWLTANSTVQKLQSHMANDKMQALFFISILPFSQEEQAH